MRRPGWKPGGSPHPVRRGATAIASPHQRGSIIHGPGTRLDHERTPAWSRRAWTRAGVSTQPARAPEPDDPSYPTDVACPSGGSMTAPPSNDHRLDVVIGTCRCEPAPHGASYGSWARRRKFRHDARSCGLSVPETPSAPAARERVAHAPAGENARWPGRAQDRRALPPVGCPPGSTPPPMVEGPARRRMTVRNWWTCPRSISPVDLRQPSGAEAFRAGAGAGGAARGGRFTGASRAAVSGPGARGVSSSGGAAATGRSVGSWLRPAAAGGGHG